MVNEMSSTFNPDNCRPEFSTQSGSFDELQKLHLPPELSETVSRSQDDPVPVRSGIACGAGGSGLASKLDF